MTEVLKQSEEKESTPQAFKRSYSETETSSSSTPPTYHQSSYFGNILIDTSNEIDLDTLAEKCISQIKEGTNQYLLDRVQSLIRQRDKRIEASERFRKAQFKNLNQLFEYEIEDANSLYSRAFNDLQEAMINEVTQEKQKLQKLLSNENCNRSLRSKDSIDGSINSTSSGNNQPSKKNDNKKRISGRDIPQTISNLLEPISESEIRQDFLTIVRDLNKQAEAFYNTEAKIPEETIFINSEGSELSVGNEHFSIGDYISIFTILSQDWISGMLTAISKREIVVRSPSGSRISFHISQLQGGRIKIIHDRDQPPK